MYYYQEITLIPQAELSPYSIWRTLYTQLHLALVEHQDDQHEVGIGVAFPAYGFGDNSPTTLGAKLRLFAATEGELQQLNIAHWLTRLSDYVHLTGVRAVPERRITGYSSFYRIQTKSSPERLARRRAKQGDISYEDALAQYNHKAQITKLPYLQLESLSNGHPFRLFIARKPATGVGTGRFSTYGLSTQAAVPEFV